MLIMKFKGYNSHHQHKLRIISYVYSKRNINLDAKLVSNNKDIIIHYCPMLNYDFLVQDYIATCYTFNLCLLVDILPFSANG